MESRTQGSRPRPRTQKKSEAKNSLSEDRHSRGQGQECSRPRPRTKDTKRKCSPKKKRSSQKFFKRSPLKNVFQKIFQALHKILTFQKIVRSSSRGQANFRGLEASRPRPRTSKCVLEDVLEAKDVLEDSTSGNISHHSFIVPVQPVCTGNTCCVLVRVMEKKKFKKGALFSGKY